MSFRTRRLRKPLIAGVCATALLAGAGVASGASAVLVDSGSGSGSTGGSVNGTCSGQLGVATGFNDITYAVEAAATATHRRAGVVAVGTAVRCRIINASTGTRYGGVSGGAPGPVAVAAGTVTFPRTAAVRVCVEANAVFSDGSAAAFSNC